MAERVGFEPTVGCPITSFQDWLLKPLGHLSNVKKIISFYPAKVKHGISLPAAILPKLEPPPHKGYALPHGGGRA